jgi:MFS family permease
MRANDRKRARIVVVLLFIFMVINFADKAVIGIAAVPIMQELELGPCQFGLVGSSFFLLFAVSSVATGLLVNRVQTRLGAAGDGLHLGADPVSDDRLGRVRNPGGPSYRARDRRRSHNTGGAAFRLQMVPNELRTVPTAVIVRGGAIGVMVALPLLNWVRPGLVANLGW